jgi:sugar-specific transcriptional regulator TrmB
MGMENLLTEKEKKVLQALYHIGSCPVSRLSKETLINRTSLYPIIEGLIQKGLVSKYSQNGIALFEPIKLELFKDWLKNKKTEASDQIKEMGEWLQQTQSGRSVSLVSKISYFEGFDGVKAMYADTWRDNKGKLIRAITDPKAAVNTMGEFFYKKYMPDRIAHGVRVKDIMNDSKEGRHETKISNKYLREAKLAKGLFENLGIEVNIYENKLAIAAYDKEKPCAVIIENEKIASAMKNIFEYMWKLT